MTAVPRRTRIVTVLNLKGGVGKTHTSWLIAAVAHERSQRLLLIDTDTQGNLTGSFLAPDQRPGVEAIFHPGAEAHIADLIRSTRFPHIDLIAGGSRLAPFDLSDPVQWEKADLQFALTEALRSIQGRYDLVCIDCPPRLSLVSFAALCASDGVIIPMEAADWGAQGILQVTAAIEYVQKHYHPGLRLLGYLVSRFKQARAYQQAYLQQLRAHFGEKAFDVTIPDLALFEKSVCDRIPITVHAPASREADTARRLYDEVVRRLEGHASGGRLRREQDLRADAIPVAGHGNTPHGR